MKVLFQGDSVTDAGRDRENPGDMGDGYPRYAAAMLVDAFPDEDFAFVNLGVSGNRTADIIARLDGDIVNIQPDIVVLLIGINDVWFRYLYDDATSEEQFEENLRTILEAVKSRTKASLLMIQPFFLESVPADAPIGMREELDRKQAIYRTLADEYADAYLPLDEILHGDLPRAPFYYTEDGIHPTPDGACFIGEACLGAMTHLVELLSAEDA